MSDVYTTHVRICNTMVYMYTRTWLLYTPFLVKYTTHDKIHTKQKHVIRLRCVALLYV